MGYNLSFITHNFYSAEYIKNPYAINNGLCMEWAYLAYKIVPGVELCDNFPSHAFIRLEGKFYDAERVKGEDDWQCLPASAYLSEDDELTYNELVFSSEEEFKLRWKANNCNWDALAKKAEDFLNKCKSAGVSVSDLMKG